MYPMSVDSGPGADDAATVNTVMWCDQHWFQDSENFENLRAVEREEMVRHVDSGERTVPDIPVPASYSKLGNYIKRLASHVPLVM